MDVRAQMVDERMLRRVMALLVSFAAMAEQAATRSGPVRWFVLVLLRYAEAVSESYVLETAGMPLSEFEGIAPDGNNPDDALRLAARFYALAAALCTLLPLGGGFDWRSVQPGRVSGHAASGSRLRFSGPTWNPNNTS